MSVPLSSVAGTRGPAPLFEGEFETHVTVHCDGTELDRLAAWSGADGLKLTHIVLGRGRVRSQPMLTVTGSGTLADRRGAASALAGRLAEAGFDVVRTKIEATPWTRGVPADDTAALVLGPGFYFEHHIKLLLEPDADREALAASVTPHGAHLSWNARRVGGSGSHQRFVTQRCHGVGAATAHGKLDALCAMLRSRYQVVSVHREFVVFDSDATLDDGWIPGAAPARPVAFGTGP
jgi:hypothetical protein